MNQNEHNSHSQLHALRATMARLRAPGGCPWDIEQTHHSLRRYLVEETSELLDTLDRLDFDHMKEELGDVLLQVYFHAQIAEESGKFDLEDVAAGINKKLIDRHPHVFGEMQLQDSEAVLRQWEKLKQMERAASGKSEPRKVLKDLPPKLPALLYAADVLRQLRKHKLLAPESACTEAIHARTEGLDELTAGQILFILAGACEQSGIDPETALRTYASKVESDILKLNPVTD